MTICFVLGFIPTKIKEENWAAHAGQKARPTERTDKLMRIDSSTIGMESARTFSAQSKQTVSTSVTVGQLLTGGFNFSGLILGQNGERLRAEENESQNGNMNDRTEDIRTRLNGFMSQRLFGQSMVGMSREQTAQLKSIRQKCIDFLFQLLFRGNSKKLGTFGQGQNQANEATLLFRPIATNVLIQETNIRFEYHEFEETSYTTTGTVKMQDGREIEFDLNIIMTREFKATFEEHYIQVSQLFADPLVINLDGFIAELSDQTFIFDLEGNGTMSNISILSSKSGYLAIDKCGSGVIRDGSQLFGTVSGNGFADLALHDTDGNGWIDAGDEIWKYLRIWIMEPDGSCRLYSLADKGIGAIYLGHIATDFTLTNHLNEAKGMIRSTGLFLYESGAVGSVQQVDVVKFEA